MKFYCHIDQSEAIIHVISLDQSALSTCDGVGHQDGYEDGDGVGDLAGHLEHDHGDGESVGHCPREGRRPDCGVTPGADHREVRTVPNA